MPFPYDAADLAAIDRLANFYNGGDYDASTNPGGMGRGGHRINFENALADAARVGAANSAAAAAAGTSATNAATSEGNAALSAAKLIGSSATSVGIAAGGKDFVTQSGKFFAVGTFVLVYSAANPTANYMAGQVSAYSGTDLTVNVTVTEGSGTFADWVIAVAGSPGARGLPGLLGPVGPTPDIMVTFSDGVTDSDPGNGLLKFNNAAPASTTRLFIDNLDRYGTSITSWLDSFDDSTNTALRGSIKLVQVSDPTKYARFDVVGAVIDGTGYRKIPVVHVLSSGTFTNAAILAIDFVRTGNRGLDGDGAGDVLGPAVATDNHVALFDGTSGKLLKSGGALAPVATNGLASSVSVTPTGSLGASSVQAALAELDDEKQPRDDDLTAIAGLVSAADKFVFYTGPGAAALASLSAAGRDLIADTTVEAQRTRLALPGRTLTIGSVTSAVATVEVTIPAGIDEFELRYRNFLPSAGAYLLVQFKLGGSWYTSSGNYAWTQQFGSTASSAVWNQGSGGDAISSAIMLTANAPAHVSSGLARIYPGDGSNNPSIDVQNAYGQILTRTIGYLGIPARAEALRLLYSTGNVRIGAGYELTGIRR